MMAAAARGARRLARSEGRLAEFVLGRRAAEGGFRGRSRAPDLYYTMFALQCLDALGGPGAPAGLAPYLDGFGQGDGLDLVHYACLVRCRAMLGGARGGALVDPRARIESFRAADGAYALQPGATRGTAYGAFVAVGLYQDLGLEVPAPATLLAAVRGFRTGDGAYANGPSPLGTTPATAAAVCVCHVLAGAADEAAVEWLLARFRRGGACASPLIPMPDLLSTATALLALALVSRAAAAPSGPVVRFIESLRRPDGGFAGHALDRGSDVEYAFYALLAAGALCDGAPEGGAAGEKRPP
jgi:prenyltransferase beta subunit